MLTVKLTRSFQKKRRKILVRRVTRIFWFDEGFSVKDAMLATELLYVSYESQTIFQTCQMAACTRLKRAKKTNIRLSMF